MAQLSPLTFRISKIWGAPQGTVEKHTIDAPLHYPEDQGISPSSNLKADIMIIKLKDELSVILTEGSIDLNFVCPLCLEPFVQNISIESAEREFLYEAPKKFEDEGDLYLIDRKMMAVDLSEMIRQEIILHFPLIPVCSKSCKGLCMYCGQDLNEKKCGCKDEVPDTYKPFAHLKDLVKKPAGKPKKIVSKGKKTASKK